MSRVKKSKVERRTWRKSIKEKEIEHIKQTKVSLKEQSERKKQEDEKHKLEREQRKLEKLKLQEERKKAVIDLALAEEDAAK